MCLPIYSLLIKYWFYERIEWPMGESNKILQNGLGKSIIQVRRIIILYMKIETPYFISIIRENVFTISEI